MEGKAVEPNKEKKVQIIFTIFCIIFLLQSVGVYGPLSVYYQEDPVTAKGPNSGIPLVIMHLLFTLVGFGCLLT